MNAERRKEIAKLVARIDELRGLRDTLRDDVDSVMQEEQDYFDNMPESLQGGEKGERATAAVDKLQEAYDALDGLDLDEVESALNEAGE